MAETATIKIEREIDLSVWYQCAMLGTATGYWASRVEKLTDVYGQTVIVVGWYDDPDSTAGGEHFRILTVQDIADAIVALDADWQGDGYQGQAYRALLDNPEDADWDTETDDAIIQMATFGHLVYG